MGWNIEEDSFDWGGQVVSFTGTWVETCIEATEKYLSFKSYPLRVRGLKHGWRLYRRAGACRILYGYVGWNPQGNSISIPNSSRILYGYVGWNIWDMASSDVENSRILYGYVGWNFDS